MSLVPDKVGFESSRVRVRARRNIFLLKILTRGQRERVDLHGSMEIDEHKKLKVEMLKPMRDKTRARAVGEKVRHI